MVEPVRPVPVHCEDRRQHYPLVGGITITSFQQDSDGLYSSGTLGLFASINGKQPPKNIVLVSNNHVLRYPGA